MTKPNPWHVPPTGLGFDGSGGTVSDAQSHSTDPEDDPNLVEAEARLLRNDLSKFCTGKTMQVVTVAVMMLMSDVLSQYPKNLRKGFVDGVMKYLINRIR
jgi:hypothetical protein